MAVKKTQDNSYDLFRQELKAGKIGQLYIFYGEETFRREEALSYLKKKLVPDWSEEFNYRTFTGKSTNVEDLLAAIDRFPMMSERTLIVVTDFDLFGCKEAQRDRLLEAFSNLPEYLCLVFVFDVLAYKPGNSKLIKTVRQVGSVVQFVPASPSDLTDWIRRRFARLGKEIDRNSCEYLTFLCGGLMTGLDSEITKIAHYVTGFRVTTQDIRAVADPVLEARVFDMTDAVGNRDFDRALSVLSDLYGLHTHPILILATLGKHLRQVYTARLVLESGQSPRAFMDAWDMKNTWQVDKMMKCARQCSLAWCRKAVLWAGEADLAMKSTGRDPEEILTDLMLRLAQRTPC